MANLAILGCAHIHTPGFIKAIQKRSAEVTVTSVWDHDASRGRARAGELSARFDAEYRSILDDPEVTALVVCSETVRHEELVLAAAAARSPKRFIFVEKPLGMGGRDGFAMAGAIERAGMTFQTGYVVRGGPMVNFIRQHVQKGTFGRITRVRASNCHSGALGGWFDKEWRWMADVTQAGCGAFGDLGTHSLDILLWIFGDVTEVTATLDHGTARYPDCDETGEAILRFKSGAIGTLAAAWDDVANPMFLEVSGTEGHAAIIDWKLYVTCKAIEGADGKTPFTNLSPERPSGFDAFLDLVTGKPADTLALVPARAAAYRSAVMESIYHAAKAKKWVTVTPPVARVSNP